MNKKNLRSLILPGLLGLGLMVQAYAGAPMWVLTPVAGYSPAVTVSTMETATIQYQVTNRSRKAHTLRMRPIQGITSSGCASSLGGKQSCILSVTVTGSALAGDVTGGPVLCDGGSLSSCYQPSAVNSLAIHLTQPSPVHQYTVTPTAGSNGSISPMSAQVVSSGATLTFTATPLAGYAVNQWLVDGTVVQTGGTIYQLSNITANHAVKVTFGTVTLTPSVSPLALSVNCPSSSASSSCVSKNDALTGTARRITITNNGSLDATNVVISTSGLPTDTVVSPSTCGTIHAGGTCVITVTPGENASSNGSGTLCTSGVQPAGTVNVSADGGFSTAVNTYVLSYGCVYQGGFIYSVDDTRANTGSIGGKVVSLVEQATWGTTSGPQTNIIWSSNGSGLSGSDVDYSLILGIDENSTTSAPSPTAPAYPAGTPAYTPCNGRSDGACNTNNIVSYYQYNRASGGSAPTPLTYYAAGLCKATINTYSDWFLPALCDFDGLLAVGCPTGTQSMMDTLAFFIPTGCPAPSGTSCLNGPYWSSTEYFVNTDYAWYTYFEFSSFSGQATKNVQMGVRCARSF